VVIQFIVRFLVDNARDQKWVQTAISSSSVRAPTIRSASQLILCFDLRAPSVSMGTTLNCCWTHPKAGSGKKSENLPAINTPEPPSEATVPWFGTAEKPLTAYYDEILLEGLRLATADVQRGLPEPRVRRETVAAALLFALGFSTVFVALGAAIVVLPLILSPIGLGSMNDGLVAFTKTPL